MTSTVPVTASKPTSSTAATPAPAVKSEPIVPSAMSVPDTQPLAAKSASLATALPTTPPSLKAEPPLFAHPKGTPALYLVPNAAAARPNAGSAKLPNHAAKPPLGPKAQKAVGKEKGGEPQPAIQTSWGELREDYLAIGMILPTAFKPQPGPRRLQCDTWLCPLFVAFEWSVHNTPGMPLEHAAETDNMYDRIERRLNLHNYLAPERNTMRLDIQNWRKGRGTTLPGPFAYDILVGMQPSLSEGHAWVLCILANMCANRELLATRRGSTDCAGWVELVTGYYEQHSTDVERLLAINTERATAQAQEQ